MTFSCLRKSPSPWDTGGTLMDLAQTQADAMDLAQTQADAMAQTQADAKI